MTTVELKAFIDESGTHDGSTYTVMAGWIGRADKFAEMEGKWRQLLSHNGLTHVHGVDLRQGRRQFKDKTRWPEWRRRNIAESFSGVAEKSSLFSLSVLLRNSDYDIHYIGADKKLRKHRSQIDSKYGVCLRVFMSILAQMVPKYAGEDAQVTLVLEAGHRNGGAAQTILRGMYELAPDVARFISPHMVYALKVQTPGVQAADLLAYPVYVLERDGKADVSDLPGLPEQFPSLDQIVNYRIPISVETLTDIKTGQIAAAHYRRLLGPHWLALDGYPEGWRAIPLRSVDGFVLRPPTRSAVLPLQAVAPYPENPEPAHYVRLESV